MNNNKFKKFFLVVGVLLIGLNLMAAWPFSRKKTKRVTVTVDVVVACRTISQPPFKVTFSIEPIHLNLTTIQQELAWRTNVSVENQRLYVNTDYDRRLYADDDLISLTKKDFTLHLTMKALVCPKQVVKKSGSRTR